MLIRIANLIKNFGFRMFNYSKTIKDPKYPQTFFSKANTGLIELSKSSAWIEKSYQSVRIMLQNF